MNYSKQTFTAKIVDGKIEFTDKTGSAVWLSLLDNKEVEITIKKSIDKRSEAQNRALHVYFTQVSDEMVEQGVTVRAILEALKEGVELWTTPVIVKEIWRIFQKAELKKVSTTELEKHKDIDIVYEAFTKFIGEKFQIYVEFPHDPEPDPRFQ